MFPRVRPLVAASVALLSLSAVSSLSSCVANAGEPASGAGKVAATAAALELVVTDIDGKKVDLKGYRGTALLIVNVASECGYTPQYAELQQLHQKYKDRGFTVLGFPSNDYGGQEPNDGAAIKKFAATEYGVTFPLFEKVHTSGKEMCPLYQKLTTEKGAVKWNFTKFLVNPAGFVVAKFDSGTNPLSPELTGALEAVLPKKG
ncbi:MAG: glutathione peroxidase [Deltaproteobacteria bacterium]|nr:glutathione peroxidase [Deltaproteobacteria bacterium]